MMSLSPPDPRHMIQLAYMIAELSPDPSTRVGAVLSGGSTLEDSWTTGGWNHFTEGVELEFEDELLRDRDMKMKWIEHAERNAIFSAVRGHFPIDHKTVMYCTWGTCTDCARAVVECGIRTLVRHKQASERCPERWAADLTVADEILRVGGVEIVEYDGTIGKVKGLIDGKEWLP
jgi:deoxycytidylate deaminase